MRHDTPDIKLFLPSQADERLKADTHRIIHAVASLGGAVGYAAPPNRDETDPWLDSLFHSIAHGDAAMAVALVNERPEAIGFWVRQSAPVFRHSAELRKIMAHPAARGLGLGALVVEALVDDARKAGLETLHLGVRGNNHGAIELYERYGFREWGRLPNVIEVGDLRFDDVRMYLELGRAPGVVLCGSAPEGPGSSPRRSPSP
ncbi:L-amino acid N-acyltransferase YncA [Sinosporangium album]|uniref:L-amino acid N-acyltransferase YncA n=1 Tax=Sinosporangium album TaxID=504805 RepID=A0A1G7UXN6_9ACTN|nr:GNAT family N-acetyltransferase [Sinosporangium album]SDG52313.1 L-amino acid N-acyltransferase YncA [Sinosporangium album]